MIKITFLILIIIQAHYSFSQSGNKIIITGTRFTYPLIKKWIEEYNKTSPEIKFVIIPRGTPNVDSANLIINAHTLRDEEIRPNFKVVDIAKYALLPIANNKNPALPLFEKKGLSEKDLKVLFFKKYDPLDITDEKLARVNKEKFSSKLYTREQKACAPTTFARNFGFEQADIIGTPIGGDDHHLIMAVKSDVNGITYNNLGFIYNLNARSFNPGLKVIPIDANGNGKLSEDENFYETVDKVIERLEKTSIPGITVGRVNVSFPQNSQESKSIATFLKWILYEGQNFNHEFGFLKLEENLVSKQIEKIE